MVESNNKNSVGRIGSKTYSPTEKELDSFDKVGFLPFKSSVFHSSLYLNGFMLMLKSQVAHMTCQVNKKTLITRVLYLFFVCFR